MITIKLFKEKNRSTAKAWTKIESNLGQTYLARNKTFLSSRGLHDEISSCEVTMSSDETGTAWLYLFEHADFSGRYIAIRVRPGTPERIDDFRNARGVAFNDKVSSFILFRRSNNELPIPYDTQNIIPLLNDFLDGEDGYLRRLATEFDEGNNITSLRRRGEPTIEWDCFGEMAPSEQVLKLRLPLKVDLNAPLIRDREITFYFWFKPIFNSESELRIDLVGFKVDADRGVLRAERLEEMAEKMMDEMVMEHELTNAFHGMLAGISLPMGTKIVDYYLLHASGISQFNHPFFSSSTTDSSRPHVVIQRN